VREAEETYNYDAPARGLMRGGAGTTAADGSMLLPEAFAAIRGQKELAEILSISSPESLHAVVRRCGMLLPERVSALDPM